MLRRLLVGLIEGLAIGLGLGLLAARGLGWSSVSGLTAAAFSAFAGFLVGLIAGRPVWARDAKTEALLKAGVGAVAGVGLSFAIRHWLKVQIDLSALRLGVGSAGSLSATLLPIVTTALALLFEFDHDGATRTATRVAGGARQRLAASKNASELEEVGELRKSDEQVEHKTRKH
jgi:hypothetical protein